MQAEKLTWFYVEEIVCQLGDEDWMKFRTASELGQSVYLYGRNWFVQDMGLAKYPSKLVVVELRSYAPEI